MKRDRDSEVEAVNQEMNAPEDRRDRRAKARTEGAMWPASGAPVHHARIGAELASEGKAIDSGETAQALKRAAEKRG